MRRILSELAFLLPHRFFEPFGKPFRIRRVKAQRRREDPRLVAPLLVQRAERIIAQLRYFDKCPLSVWQLHLAPHAKEALSMEQLDSSELPKGQPRARRVEYPGAIYYVMDRGDRREDILLVFTAHAAKSLLHHLAHEPPQHKSAMMNKADGRLEFQTKA